MCIYIYIHIYIHIYIYIYILVRTDLLATYTYAMYHPYLRYARITPRWMHTNYPTAIYVYLYADLPILPHSSSTRGPTYWWRVDQFLLPRTSVQQSMCSDAFNFRIEYHGEKKMGGSCD